MSSTMEEPLIEPKSPEPLPLRPPVGSEFHPNVEVRLREFFHPPKSQRRVMCISVLCLLFMLVLMFTILFVFSPNMGLSHGARHPLHSCRLNLAQPRLHMTEVLTMNDDSHDYYFNVTMSADDSAKPTVYHAMHLCAESVSVLRKGHNCYVRPMNAQWREMCRQLSPGNKQINERLRHSANARLTEEQWFAQPLASLINLIRNPFVTSFCSNMQSFQLVSRPPALDYTVDSDDVNSNDKKVYTQSTPTPRPTLLEPEPQVNEIDLELDDEEEIFPFADLSKNAPRRIRRSAQSPDETRGENGKRRHVLRCKHLTDLYEASPIPLESDDKPVIVSREKLFLCPPME